jgi:benzodiazapine receptor
MNTLTRNIDIKKLAGAIALCELIGMIAAFFTINAIKNWYVYLNKPEFNPPNWIFGPVWTLLYLLMGIAFYNTMKYEFKQNDDYKHAVALFWVQLTLNFLWTIAFFGFRNPILAFVIIIALIASICFWIMKLQKLHKTSAYLQIPYLLWCCFATVLNYYIIHLN